MMIELFPNIAPNILQLSAFKDSNWLRIVPFKERLEIIFITSFL